MIEGSTEGATKFDQRISNEGSKNDRSDTPYKWLIMMKEGHLFHAKKIAKSTGLTNRIEPKLIVALYSYLPESQLQVY